MKIDTPFKDSCSKTIPQRPAVSEPNLPSGMPGRTGGLLPEVLRDKNVTPKKPGWISPENPNFNLS